MSKNFVITSYIPNTDIDAKFVQCLNTFCNVNNAELHLLQCKSNYLQDEDMPLELAIQEEFAESLKLRGYQLNKHLYVSDFRISINTIDPLSGMESFAAKHGCMILPFPRHRFKTIPRMLRESLTPRAIWCTGTISEPNTYKNNKSGTRMKDYHVKGALFVQIEDDETFHIRQLQFDGRGFFDLDILYLPNRTRGYQPLALSMGDDHALFQNSVAMNATMDMIEKLRPKAIFRHDTLDFGNAGSHHLIGKHLTKARLPMTMEEELKITSDSIALFEKKFPNTAQYMVASNHPEHLDRYIDEARYFDDYPNHIIGLELALAKAKGHNIYEFAMNKYNRLENTIFLNRKDSVKMAGIELADHGDFGANGAKGSTKEKGVVYSGKCITGHTHAPEIGIYGNFVNGTLTHLTLPYTKDSGSSSWLWTNTLLYPNGKMTHLHIIPKRSK
jgi:hypothetical protein